MKPHQKLLLSLVSGALLGTLLNFQTDLTLIPLLNTYLFEPVGQIFLRLIFMIVVPMVFSGLVIGVYQLGRHHGLGRVASKTMLYTFLSSTASVLIGVGLVNIFQPGQGFRIPVAAISAQSASVDKVKANVAGSKPALQALIDLIPKNPLDAAT
jgi:DAACS family dicarboxylate/amino acid:cation (Na+ or H+) symporter